VKKILAVVIVVGLAVSFCYAEESVQLKAAEPVSSVVGVSGVIVGTVTNVVEKSLTAGKSENSLVLADSNGKTKVVPLDNTVKIIDNTFNALTLDQLKGKKVSVNVTNEKATQVQVVK
jgi:xanthosine utilization system XapX-like protein